MATYDDEYIDSYLYSSYNPYVYRYTKPKGMRRKQNTYMANYGDTEAYFDTHRAHLKSVLSQINPKLTPRLRRANTHDVGVQVNPKTDTSVQCSLGPRTLMARKRDSLRKRSQEDPQSPGSPVGGVRYPRSLAVYSPIATRRLASFIEENKRESRGAQTREQKDAVKVNTDGNTSEEKSGPRKKSTKVNGQSKTDDVQVDEEASKSKARVRFQFLEQKYGYYHCRECNLRWESAYVWCVQGTNKVYFKQFCRTCQKSFNPYRVEDITCQNCNKARCSCAVTPRHVDPKRPHRQDLCGRCKGKRLSCDSTFSFKYII